MAERDDFELLRQYATHGSQQAFAEVVRRHTDLVYSSAMRRVRDRHAAQDVTQVVFIVLARKAKRIRPGPTLGSWLLGVTRLASNDWLKGEARRLRREDAAARERSQHMAPGQNPPSPDAAAGGVLDDAITRLPAAARDALVLRFFEGKSFREVGERLSISPKTVDTYKQRIEAKLGLSHRAEYVQFALKLGLLTQ